MIIGDKLICICADFSNFTKNKKYEIYKIEHIGDENIGFIKDDDNNSTYFTERCAEDEYWKYDISQIRFEKLEKIKNIHENRTKQNYI